MMHAFRLLFLLTFLIAMIPLAMPNAMAAGGGEEASASDSGDFISLEPLSIPIIKQARVRGFLQLEVGLHAKSPEMRRYIQASLPRLRDAYIRNMNVFATNHIVVERVPDVDAVGKTLQAITDHALRRKGAKVLFGQIMIQHVQ